MRTAMDIYSLWQARRSSRGALLEQMRAVADQANGDIIVPLPELTAGEKPAVANLLTQGLDALSQRIASVRPDVNYPPLRAHIDKQVQRAATRRQVNLGWWDHSKMGLQMRKRARHYLGYGMSVAQIIPDFDTGVPRWVLRNPLTAFPAPPRYDLDQCPADAIFGYQRSAADIGATYGLPTRKWQQDKMFEVIEYTDDEQTMVLVVGPAIGANEAQEFSGLGKQVIPLDGGMTTKNSNGRIGRTGGESLVVAQQYANKAGVCSVVLAGRITLDRIQGHFDAILGMYYTQARLQALEILAVEQSIFPNEWLMARQGEDPEIIAVADGRVGSIGVVRGGIVQSTQLVPAQAAGQMIDRLERNQRVTSGTVPQTGGENPTNVRTGRASSNLMSATIDFPIQEAQDIFTESLAEENKRAIAIAKGYFGNTPKSFYVNWRGAKGQVDYTPNDIFDTDNNVCSFAHAGSDANSLVVSLGQRIGQGYMSKHSAAALDPMIDDADEEHRLVLGEQLEASMLAGLQQAAQTQALAPHDLAAITRMVVEEKMTLYAATEKAQAQAQARQASSGPPGTPTGPAQPGSPEAQPGLAAGTPAAAGAAAPEIAPPAPSQQNLSQLLSALHRPQMMAQASNAK